MGIGKISTAIAAVLALTATPVMAAGQSVRASSSALSAKALSGAKANARKGTFLSEASKATSGVILGVIALGVVVTAVVIAADDNDDEPTSD